MGESLAGRYHVSDMRVRPSRLAGEVMYTHGLLPVTALERGDRREAERIAELVALNLATLPTNTCPLRRGQHPKHHGCVEASFRVRDDVPEHLRHGVFAQARQFRALVRFSNGRVDDDRRSDAHGMAIKLLDVSGVKLLANREHETVQDFVLVDSETFFTGDAGDYARVNRATMGKRWTRLFAWLALLARPRLLHRVSAFIAKQPGSPLDIAYFSTVPYRLGEAAVKYAVVPREQRAAGSVDSPDGLAAVLRDQLSEGTASFNFCVDVQSDARAHPIEDPTISWSARGAKRVVLAELLISSQLVDPASPFAENLLFSPWHALPAHEPLGYINRARAPIYRAMGEARHLRANLVPPGSSEVLASYGDKVA